MAKRQNEKPSGKKPGVTKSKARKTSKLRKTNQTRKARKIRKGKQHRFAKAGTGLFAVLVAAVFITGLLWAYQKKQDGQAQPAPVPEQEYEGKIPRPKLDVELLDMNEYSRPALALHKVNGVVIHYTANPGSSAIANRNYFESLKDTHTTKASSHFIVGLEGEIVQCIPCSEISYASNSRNYDTIAIECCIEDDTGKFNQKTYGSVVHLTAWLVERYGLEVSDVIRHYDITGKICPKYFVEFPAAWEQFHEDVLAYLNSYGIS